MSAGAGMAWSGLAAGVERAVVEYLANALWQLPVLAAGAWLLLRGARPGVLAQHRVWVAVLGLAVVLPGVGMGGDGAARVSTGTALLSAPHAQDSAAAAAAAAATAAGAGRGERGGVGRGALLGGELGGVARSGLEMASRKGAALRELVRARRLRLTARVTHLLVGLYGATLAFGLLRVVRAWAVARGVVRRSRAMGPPGVSDLWWEFGQGRWLRRGGLPELRQSAEVMSPVVVGAWAPVLVLPEGIGRYTQAEVRAVLCHELAHVARRDYLANLACQVAGLPLGWHPVLHEVQRQIRRTREMVCDRMAARSMESELVYARCLLSLARGMFGAERVAEAGVGLFSSNVLEERVMRLIERNEMRLRTKVVRVAWGAVGMVSALTVATMVHVTPTWAAAPAPVAQSAGTEAMLAPPVPPAAPAMPVAPLVPAAPVAAPKPSPVPRPTPVPAPMSAVPQVASPVPRVPPTPVAPRAVSENSGDVTIVDGVRRQLTPEEQRALDKEMAEMQRQVKAATANLPGPEFQRQLDQQRKDLDRKIAAATAKIDSAALQQQIAEAARKAANAEALVNSPEFKQKLADAQRKATETEARVNSPEFQQRLQQAQEQMQRAARELDEAARRLQEAHPEPAAPK